MNDINDKDFNNFKALIENWLNAYAWCVYSYVSLKTQDGYRLLFGRLIFEPSGFVYDKKPFEFKTESVKAGLFAAKITPDKIVSILERAKNGEMMLVEDVQKLDPEQNQSYSSYLNPITHPAVAEGLRLPNLVIRGDSKQNLLVKTGDVRLLDWELKAADVPFYNLDELMTNCSLPSLSQMSDSTTFEIVARSPAYIVDTSIIKGGQGVVDCNIANGLDVKRLRVGYKIHHKGEIERGNVSGDRIELNDASGFKKGRMTIPVKDAAVMQAFLSYADTALHQWWIFDREKQLNPRYAIHQVFDQELEQLKEMLLKPDKSKSDVFEYVVSILFNLLGFSVSSYGRIPKYQDGPDIVIVTPNGHVGVVECTMGLLDEKDKLAKLVKRTNLIRDKLEASGHSYVQIQPVIVTPLTKNEIEANLELASKHKIAVISKEDIERLLGDVRFPMHPDELFQDASKLIPNNNQESLFRS